MNIILPLCQEIRRNHFEEPEGRLEERIVGTGRKSDTGSVGLRIGWFDLGGIEWSAGCGIERVEIAGKVKRGRCFCELPICAKIIVTREGTTV
jgi:hypothetical protein